MSRGTVLSHDWFPAALPANVRLGEGSWLHSAYALVHFEGRRDDAVQIGRHSGLYKGTFLDLGPEGRVRIGDFCAFVAACIATNGSVTIGDYVLVAHEVVIADSPAAVPAPHDPGSEIIIGNDCWIGARAVILGPSRLGRGVIVGAATVVQGDFPDYAIVAGNPAVIVGWAKPEGERP